MQNLKYRLMQKENPQWEIQVRGVPTTTSLTTGGGERHQAMQPKGMRPWPKSERTSVLEHRYNNKATPVSNCLPGEQPPLQAAA